jgi:hypothetical protein
VLMQCKKITRCHRGQEQNGGLSIA